MTHQEMNFERCQALDKAKELRKQNAELRKVLKSIKTLSKDCIDNNIEINISMEGEDGGSFTYSNVILEMIIKRINKALKPQ